MDMQRANEAAQALMTMPSFQQIATYLAQPDPERIDQSAAARSRIAHTLLWQRLQTTSWTDAEQRAILEPLVALTLGQPVVVATVEGRAQSGELILVSEGHDRYGRTYGHIVVAIESFNADDGAEMDNSRASGWHTTCRAATAEERASDAYQRMQRASDAIRTCDGR